MPRTKRVLHGDQADVNQRTNGRNKNEMGRIQQKGRRENEEATWRTNDVLPVDDRDAGIGSS